MRQKIKYGVLCTALLLSSFTGSATNESVAATSVERETAYAYTQSTFNDVARTHYSYDAILWAKDRGIVSGYMTNGVLNGMFGPDDQVTEAQFVKMVVQYLGLQDDEGDIAKNGWNYKHWSDSHYDAIAKYAVPLRGYVTNQPRDLPMKRGTVAQALGYLIGGQKDVFSSIYYLMNNGITNGQNPAYEDTDLHQYFGSANELTRAQVVTFLYRMEMQQLNQLSNLAIQKVQSDFPLTAKAVIGQNNADRDFDKVVHSWEHDFNSDDLNDPAYLEYLKALGVDMTESTSVELIEGVNLVRDPKPLFND